MTVRYACARHARETAEPLYATASPILRWLLIEQDGHWGHDAVLESRIDPATGRALKARAAGLGARLLLVRRHGARGRSRHRVFFAVTDQREGFVEEVEVATPADVLDLDLSPLRDHRRCGGRLLREPLFLVCTNGRHDACCAEYGRPLDAALASSLGDRVWE